jgi:hypothetical protein
MRRQCNDKRVHLFLPLQIRPIEHILSNIQIDKAGEAYPSLAFRAQVVTLCLCLIHGGESCIEVQVLGLGRSVCCGCTRNLARLLSNVLVERHNHLSESILASRCINNPCLPGYTQLHFQHSVRHCTSVGPWNELCGTSWLSDVNVQNLNGRGCSCCTVSDSLQQPSPETHYHRAVSGSSDPIAPLYTDCSEGLLLCARRWWSDVPGNGQS